MKQMNILIVDDQISVVNGLVKGIDWDSLGITGVFKAFSVYEAKALFNNMTIDLLLTDIEMPGESGISLVKWIREQKFETECIFLTSHADFEYARDAIKFDSFEYILQPCPYPEIQSIVSNAIYKINQKKEQQKFYAYGKIAMNDTPIMKLMFHDCLKLENNAVPVRFLISLGIFPDMNVQGYLTLFQITKYDFLQEQWDNDLLEFTLHNVISDVFESFGQKILVANTEASVYAFFCFHSDSYLMPSQLYERQLDILKGVFHDLLKLTIVCYPGSMTDVSSLHEQYLKLEECRKNSLMPEKVLSLRNELQEEAAVTCDGSFIDTIIRYIHENPEEDITRQDLADLVHLNIDYMSRVFKKETNYTLNDYIILEKMKLAQNLIRTTVLPIGLIANKVGYSNFSYFSKLYKKFTGATPLEDRSYAHK